MHPHRLRAPSSDGALLADPALGQAGETLDANAARLDRWDHDFQGRRAGRLRAMARAQVMALAKRYHEAFGLDWPDVPAQPARLVVTGHQPELFHPGVWVKNFAVAGLAEGQRRRRPEPDRRQRHPQGAVDPRPAPRRRTALRASPVAFDVWAGEVPYEDQTVQDEALFASFADRARSTLGGLDRRPDARRLLAQGRPPGRVDRPRGPPVRAGPPRGRGRVGGAGTSRSRSARSASRRRSSGSPRTSWRTCRGSRPPTTRRSPATGRPTASGARTTRSPRSPARGNGSKPRSGPGGPTPPGVAP